MEVKRLKEEMSDMVLEKTSEYDQVISKIREDTEALKQYKEKAMQKGMNIYKNDCSRENHCEEVRRHG